VNPAIGPGELPYGVPEARIVNAAFAHPGLDGRRFQNSRRGAWYAGVELETSVREVGYHKCGFLKDARITERLSFDYQDFLVDLSGQFHVLDENEQEQCLPPEPIPECYGSSQAIAKLLVIPDQTASSIQGVALGGECVACFGPALVFHPRRGEAYSNAEAAVGEEI
jgi:hypothetical protein